MCSTWNRRHNSNRTRPGKRKTNHLAQSIYDKQRIARLKKMENTEKEGAEQKKNSRVVAGESGVLPAVDEGSAGCV